MHLDRDGRDNFVVIDAIRKIVRELRDSARVAQGRTGITGAQLFVLRVLATDPGLSINELAARTMTHQSSVSVVVSRLVEHELVMRHRAADDGRRLVVTLTARGRALHRRAPAVAQELLIAAVGKLPRLRRRALADGLGALVEALGASERATSMFFENEAGGDDAQKRPGSRRAARATLNGKKRPAETHV